MTVQPIRLFGDPVLRTPAAPVVDFDKELRTLVHGPHRHHARGPGRRPRRTADRRRAAGVHLRTSTARSATWSTRRSTCRTRSRTARRAACRSPGSPSTAPARIDVVATGFDMHGEPVRDRGHRAARARASSTRPTTSTASCSSTGSTRRPRKAAMKAIREAEWCGAGRPDGQGESPHPTRGLGRLRSRCGWSSPARPDAGAARRCEALLAQPARGGRRRHPARRARPAAAAGSTASPVGAAAPTSTASQVLKPEHAARARASSAGSRELAPDCCPVVAYGALVPPSRARHPAARLGQPALLAAAGLARGGPGAARDHAPATR